MLRGKRSILELVPIAKSTLTSETVRRLRDAILSGQLAGGTALPEAQTALQLGVSRVPVREALVELERQGLVEFDRNGRASVRAFTDEDIAEIMTLRGTLQTMAARHAASRLTEAHVQRLEALLAQAEATHDLAKFSALDAAFHDEIVAIAGHRRLHRVWLDLRAQMDLWIASVHRRRESAKHDVRKATLRSHREMIDVLKTRKPDAAAALMERHCAWKEFPPV